MVFEIEHLKIELTENEYGILLNAFNSPILLPGQSLYKAKEIVLNNFKFVKTHFLKFYCSEIEIEEFYEICLKIVLHYFYLYNFWKNYNEKEKDRDLNFLIKDFSHPNTYDLVIRHFKNKNPKEYIFKSSQLLDLSIDKLKEYEYNRDEFYNAFK